MYQLSLLFTLSIHNYICHLVFNQGEKERKAGRRGRIEGWGVSLLSGGSEFVQKGATLFTVSLRTLAEASSKGRPHLQVTWVPVSVGSSEEGTGGAVPGRKSRPASPCELRNKIGLGIHQPSLPEPLGRPRR